MKTSFSFISIFLVFSLCLSIFFSVSAFADTAILDDQAVRAVTLTGDGAAFDCGGVTVSGSVITVSAPGVYAFTGTLNNGQIVVNLHDDEQAKLILSGVNITSLTDSAIYVANADKVTVEAADGTDNTVVSGSDETAASYDDSRSGAAIYASCDLKFTGSGTLRVSGLLNNGIGTKKDLDIKNCTLIVDTVNNGLKGNNSVEISSASIRIRAANDGIKTESEKEGKGYVTITGSSLDIVAAEGITATGQITIVP